MGVELGLSQTCLCYRTLNLFCPLPVHERKRRFELEIDLVTFALLGSSELPLSNLVTRSSHTALNCRQLPQGGAHCLAQVCAQRIHVKSWRLLGVELRCSLP